MPKINKVLFVQHRGVIDEQRLDVERIIDSSLGVPVAFVSSPQEVTNDAKDYDVVIAPTLPWLDQLLTQLPNLRWVHFMSAGVEKIWNMQVDWSQLTLSKSSGVHAVPMSEYTIGAMLYFAKDFDKFVKQARAKEWQRAWLGELTDKNVVILGMGSVGTAVADRATSFGMNVVGIATKEKPESIYRVDSIDHVNGYLPWADYVVLTLPLTSQTRGLVDGDFLSSLKRGAVLVDISRGGVVKSKDLVTALDTGHLRGAALDVFETEPLDSSSPLWNRANVLITPHVAGTTPHYLSRAMEIFLTNAHQYKNNEPLQTAINPMSGY